MNIVVIGGETSARGWPRWGARQATGDRAWPPRRDASGADVVVVAVPGPAISAAVGQVTGLAGKIAIDKRVPVPQRDGRVTGRGGEVLSPAPRSPRAST